MRILVARDEAFNFIYRANVDALGALGKVEFFSPLHDRALPECDMLYLPGGYPELFIDVLAANHGVAEEIRRYADGGGRIYAECGGFMYLCNDIDGARMCGVLPFKATMRNARLHLGYRQMALVDNADGGDVMLRGHEFHYSEVDDSRLEAVEKHCVQRSARDAAVGTAIYRYKNVIAGYTHWYWAETGFHFFDGRWQFAAYR